MNQETLLSHQKKYLSTILKQDKTCLFGGFIIIMKDNSTGTSQQSPTILIKEITTSSQNEMVSSNGESFMGVDREHYSYTASIPPRPNPPHQSKTYSLQSMDLRGMVGGRAAHANLGTLTTNTTSQLNILWHNRHTLGVDSTKVSILKQTNEVGLRCLLKGKDGSRLETKVRLEVLCNLTDKTLEGCLADEKLRGLLVFTNLTKGHGSGTVTVGLLDASGSGGGLTGSLFIEGGGERGRPKLWCELN